MRDRSFVNTIDRATISTSDLAGEAHLLNTLSGVVDERTGELVTSEMSNRFTYCVETEYHRGGHISDLAMKRLTISFASVGTAIANCMASRSQRKAKC